VRIRRPAWALTGIGGGLVVGGVACAVGAAVSVSGNIGFVGLVVPHLLRPLVGHEPRRLLWVSALGGAILLVLADMLVQGISGRVELKLGVITALIGGPFFLYLIFKTRSTNW
jgi:iron complex transport system permease protein